MFGQSKIKELNKISRDLVSKTKKLEAENQELTNSLATLTTMYQVFTGENTINELGLPREIIIDYERLRIRSWEFLLKNHLAGLMAQKRVNWQIGSGLLFNAKPSEKPFLDYYRDEKTATAKQHQFIQDSEYLFRNFAKTKLVDYEKDKDLHGLARFTDFNAIGDGDVLLVMRVKDGLPVLQVISGQCVINPVIPNDTLADGYTINEGVECNKNGETVAFHVLTDTDTSNGVIFKQLNPEPYGTERVAAYFPGTNIRSAWLYKQSDLYKAGETRAMPLFAQLFEMLKHVNDYLIANSKHAQLLAQHVMIYEKDQNSNGERVFNDAGFSSLGMDAPITTVSNATDMEVAASANAAEYKLNGNGIVIDAPRGVKAKPINATSQSDQAEYLKSTMQSITAAIGQPYEVTISSYNSNYTASMGARSDFQFVLDTMTELVPANQLYRRVWEMFVYLQVLQGKIDCPPLLKAYNENDIITIQAITNSSFEGTKLKPIDPVKFIAALRAQIPEKYRELVPLNTLENLVNAVSGSDYESVLTQISNEIGRIPKNLEPEGPTSL
jgi:capsid protein